MDSFGSGFKVGSLKPTRISTDSKNFGPKCWPYLSIAYSQAPGWHQLRSVRCQASQHGEGPSPQGMHIGLDEIHCPHPAVHVADMQRPRLKRLQLSTICGFFFARWPHLLTNSPALFTQPYHHLGVSEMAVFQSENHHHEILWIAPYVLRPHL